MADETSFRDLLRRIRAGDAAAANELVREYEPAIRRAVRGPLADMRLRRVLDSTDISQAVLANFFTRAAGGQFDIDQPEQLLKLFVTMARNRLRDEARHHRAGRRDYRRETSDLSQHCLDGLFDNAPTPSRIVSTRELIDTVMRHLSAEERDLLEQRAAGAEWAALADRRGTSPEALRKKLARRLSQVVRELDLHESPPH